MSKKHHFVTEADENERIDKVLVRKENLYSRTQIQTWIINGLVTVNDEQVKPNYRCQFGDKITWLIPVEKQQEIEPENIPLEIVFEDEHLLVINKPRHMVIHPTVAHSQGTLVNALLNYTTKLSQVGGEERPGIVHRIDKDTSGLLVVAKDDEAHRNLSKQFMMNTCERTYEAIVHGVIDHETGIIDAPIARDPANRTKMAVVTGGRKAVTHFQVLNRYDNHTHVQCTLETGRTHQIRVHMNYIGHSVVGDPVYMDRQISDMGGQALFSQGLTFIHPNTKKFVRFKIEQPKYFQKLLEEIKSGDERI